MLDGEEECRPYSRLAEIYDELLGEAAFDCFRENFDRLVLRYGISFETCADIACGTGLAARYLSGGCEKVYAVDASREMLEQAMQRDYGCETVFLRQSFVELRLPEAVDLLTCNFDSLNYLVEPGELSAAFRRFADNLKPGGYAFFDMNTTRELEFGGDRSVLVHRLKDAFSVWESSWNQHERKNTLNMTNFIRCADGRYDMAEELHVERSYELDFLLGELGVAGFSAVEYYDARDLSAVSRETRRVQFLARR